MASTFEKKWELTPYDLQRKPSEIFVGDIESAITPKSLHKEFMCPICLDILKKTMTTKDCLHRFCAECIITAIRSNNKECPSCRKKLASKRSLRHDKNFDDLIAAIYPNLEQYEMEHEQSIAKLNSSYIPTLQENFKPNTSNHQNKPQKNTKSNINKDENHKNKRRRYSTRSQSSSKVNQNDDSESEMNPPAKNINMDTSEPSVSGEIELILKPHPLTEPIRDDESRYIKTTGSASVDHLKKYLVMRLYLDRNTDLSSKSNDSIHMTMDNVRIHIANPSSDMTALDGSETLEQLAQKFGKRNQPLQMFYSLTQI